MGGFDPSAVRQGMTFDFRNIRDVAVVSDIGWPGPASKATGALVSTKLRAFGMDELPEARIWARTGF